MRSRSVLFHAAIWTGMLAGLSGCRRDAIVPPAGSDTPFGTLRVIIVPEWEGQPLEFYHEYRNVSDYRTTVESLKFYWGDVRLVDGMATMPVSDIELFDFQNGPVTKEWKLPTGVWSGLRTGIGVPSALNHADPATFPSDHPLSVNSLMYWTWASGYKFVLFDGRYDPDPASVVPLVNTYLLQTGMDTCYMEMDLLTLLPITVVKDSITTLRVHMAVDKFFHSNFGTIDLATEHEAHEGNVDLALKLTHNMIQSFSIE
ncbi:MAG: MbnP family protein [Flavobacteriales bacterium]